MILKCLPHLIFENGSKVSFFKISYMSFVPFFVEQNSFIWKGMKGLGFEQTWFPFTQGCFVPSLVEIGPVVLEKKMKSLQTDGQTVGRRTTGDQKSSLELSA